MYYEVATQSPANRGHIVRETDIRRAPTAEERYESMFGFDAGILEWVKYQKTVSGYNGQYCAKYLWFDVDCKELEQAHEHAKNLVLRLQSELHTRPHELAICFSGAKGFHIGLHQNLFGGFGYSADLPAKTQVLAALVAGACYNLPLPEVDREYNAAKPKTFRGLDLSIYNANRLFRAPLSVNDKTGLYKTPLTADELFGLDIGAIKQLAAEPRKGFRLGHNPALLPLIQDLAVLWAEAQAFNAAEYMAQHVSAGQVSAGQVSAGQVNGKPSGPIELKNAFFGPVSEGSRNNDLFRQACMLFDLSVLSKTSIAALIACVNAASDPPLAQDELVKLIESAHKRTQGHQKPEKLITPASGVEALPNWIDEWVADQLAEKRPLTFLFPEVDAATDHNYRGKLIPFAGGAGSLKSYMLQNVFKANIERYGARCAYASMEMSKVENVNRFLNLIFDPQGESPSKTLSRIVRENKQLFYDSISGHITTYSDRLLLNNRSGIDTSALRKWVEKIDQVYGPVDILGVDGASMMKGADQDEMEAMARNSRELKELANEKNLCIVCIFHVTKSVEPHVRDVIRKARGSGKIIDNGDMFFGFSKLIDVSRSSPEHVKYHRDYGHVAFWNKRGGGEEMDLVFEIEPYTAVLKPSLRMAEEFPTFEQFSREAAKGKTVFSS